jgi:PAS domain S-box-containing protein
MNYKPGFSAGLFIKTAVLCIIVLALFFFAGNYLNDPMTKEERQWLDAQSGKIKMCNTPDYPPVQFVDQNGASLRIKNDWPIPQNIMNKGIKLVSAGEKHNIFQKWPGKNSLYFYKDPFFWMILSGILFITLCVFLYVIVRNYKLKKIIKEKNISLKKQESHLRTVIRTIPDLIWLKDVNGFFINCNHMFEIFYDVKESELKGKTDFDFIDRTQAEKFVAADKFVIENMETITFEEEVIYPVDGHKELLETIKTPLIDDKGNLVGVLGVGRNITHRKKMEQDLDKKTKELESILSNIQGITFRCKMDNNWSMTYMSSYAKKLTGYPAADFINNSKRTYGSIIYFEDRKLVSDAVHWAVKKKEPWDMEYRIVNKDNNILWVHEKGSAVFDDNGNIDFLDGFIININDRKIFEKHLIQSQKIEAIGALSGGIAHDFNNILTGIIGFAELLKEDLNRTDLDNKIKSRVDAILKGGFRASELVSQILNFSRSEVDKPSRVKISIIVKEVARLIEPVIPSNIRIKKNISSDSYVFGEPAKIHQILMNLCTNALYAMNENGGILNLGLINSQIDSPRYFAEEKILSGDFICISVKDSGCGMTEDIKKKIMTPFYTTKPKGIGTGMGLWVVEGIVKNMGGFMEVESEPGKGSEFRIYLPVFKQESEPVLKYA